MSEAAPAVDPMMTAVLAGNPQSLQEFRAVTDEFLLSLNDALPSNIRITENVSVGEATADILRRDSDDVLPVLLYFHGGGWIAGSAKTHRSLCAQIAEFGFVVVSLDYRLAPEHAFPAAYEDCLYALDWALDNARQYGGDTSNIAIGGDSAGGNLATAVSIARHLAGSSPIRSLLLNYPALDFVSMKAMGEMVPEGMPNPVDMMVNGYLGDSGVDLEDWRLSPIRAPEVLKKLPPTLLICGTEDLTVIESCRSLADILGETGVNHDIRFYEGMPHGFLQLDKHFKAAREGIQAIGQFLIDQSKT